MLLSRLELHLIVIYYPHLNGLNYILRKNFKHLEADQLAKAVFTLASSVSFRTARNLRRHLVRSSLYPLQLITGSTNVILSAVS